MNKNMNTAAPRTACNRSLPVDALNVDAVKVGDVIYYPYEVDSTPREVLAVHKGYGDRVTIVTSAGRKEARTYGTVRVVRENYNYHNGCCA